MPNKRHKIHTKAKSVNKNQVTQTNQIINRNPAAKRPKPTPKPSKSNYNTNQPKIVKPNKKTTQPNPNPKENPKYKLNKDAKPTPI